MEPELIEKYPSKFEDSTVCIYSYKDRYHLWVTTNEKRKNEVVSFDDIGDHEAVLSLYDYYVRMEQIEGIPISEAALTLFTQIELAEKASYRSRNEER